MSAFDGKPYALSDLLGIGAPQPRQQPANMLGRLSSLLIQTATPSRKAAPVPPVVSAATRALQSLPQSYGQADEGWRNSYQQAYREDPSIGSFDQFMALQRAAIARVVAKHGYHIDARPPLRPARPND